MEKPLYPHARPFRGRFAPSPTGALHFGSLVAALASCLDMRSQGGEWLLRMEDVDTPRNVPGAASSILAALEGHGLFWDGGVLWQNTRLAAYRAILDELLLKGLAYGCACSRKEIAENTAGNPDRLAIDGAARYPGTCRGGFLAGRAPRAWRLKVGNPPVFFTDRLLGAQQQNLDQDVGDFVLLRADGLFAYQLAVVADDQFQGITHITRGADLLDSTARQIWLQECLHFETPKYAHIPVAVNAAGEKLSKQTRALPLDHKKAPENLVKALSFLGQNPPLELSRASVPEIWGWALAHWDFSCIPRRKNIVV